MSSLYYEEVDMDSKGQRKEDQYNFWESWKDYWLFSIYWAIKEVHIKSLTGIINNINPIPNYYCN